MSAPEQLEAVISTVQMLRNVVRSLLQQVLTPGPVNTFFIQNETSGVSVKDTVTEWLLRPNAGDDNADDDDDDDEITTATANTVQQIDDSSTNGGDDDDDDDDDDVNLISEHSLSLTIAAVNGILQAAQIQPDPIWDMSDGTPSHDTDPNPNPHQNDHDNLPPVLKTFVPLNERPPIRELAVACTRAELLFRQTPDDIAMQQAFDQAIHALQQAYLTEIDEETKARTNDQAQWLESNGIVVAAGANHFEAVYDSVYQTINSSEAEGLAEYHRIMGGGRWRY